MDIIKVSAKSVPRMVAGAIAGAVRKNGQATVQAVGAGATNQAVKAIAIASNFITEDDQNVELVCKPSFTTAVIDDTEKTALEFSVYAIRIT